MFHTRVAPGRGRTAKKEPHISTAMGYGDDRRTYRFEATSDLSLTLEQMEW